MVSTSGLEVAERIKAFKKTDEIQSNFKVGPVGFAFEVGLREEFNDNVNLASTGRQSDWITGPHVVTHMDWAFSQINKLGLTMDLGYDKYLNHPELDTQNILVKPGSVLDFDFFVKDIHFNLHDRLAIQQDPTSTTQLSNTSSFRRMSNIIGLQADWDLNKVILSAGYDHEMFKTLDDTYSYLDQDTDTFRVRAGYRAISPLVAGVQTSVSRTEYKQTFQNNSTSVSPGAYASIIASEYLQAEVDLSYQMSSFDTGGAVGDNSRFESLVFSAMIQNQLNRWMNHSLRAARYTPLGIGSNYTDIYEINYDASFDVVRDVSLNAGGFVQFYEDSPSDQSESGTRFGLRFQAGYQLFETTRLTLSLQRIQKFSDRTGNDFDQNRITFDVLHRF
ncbi:MAG: hypothetical protein PHV34_09075 [Verrucomicrobiae bacterium]|nr:hypothetical protein [Verrucomicrobiae bacterium]